MVMLSNRVPPRVPPALDHEARARGITVGQLIDRLCDRAGFYTNPSEIQITANRVPVEVEVTECDEHEWQINTTLAYDQCIHCGHRRYHKEKA